jgi:hypothetical protein
MKLTRFVQSDDTTTVAPAPDSNTRGQAAAGAQFLRMENWIPACAGMTHAKPTGQIIHVKRH